MKACGVITLLSDFGLQDSYVAEMKGVLLKLNPKAKLVDISHLIPAGDIRVAALRLWRSYRHFPEGSVHLAVVDPDVGTSRKLLLAVSDSHFFLAPDNGLLSPVLQETRARCYALNPPKGKKTSPTFHGRDFLAPAASTLSLGKAPQQLGHPFTPTTTFSLFATEKGGRVEGKIIDVDRFGNLITNIRGSLLTQKKKFEVRCRSWRFASLEETYGNAKRAKPVALIGSSGLLEIAVTQGNAQQALQGSVGQKVLVQVESNKS